ncbi:MAG: CDP-diacylglycerol--glycerol-3-phosphate 3-phosphatidyltransferase [Alphaproteobacteria bacterium]|nr:CDP-diacylglycerol--glycerol-3-phosphate 3-phosphatidyltransferase [Alphaproteobacteria bacterium]
MIASLPNALTLSRIFVIPAFVVAFYLPAPWASWVTAGIFVAAGATDFFDGYVARRLNVASVLGRFLDPVADKLLIAAAIVMLVAVDRLVALNVVAALVILCREILVSGLREHLAGIRVSVPVTRLAKWKTTVQMVALALLLFGDAAPFGVPATELGIWGLWAAAVLTLYTGYDYLRSGVTHMRRKEPQETAAALPEVGPTPRAG